MRHPALARRRRQPLPEQRPKPASDDAEAPSKIRTILEDPSYREADEDPDFLRRGDMRGVRLMLDYQKLQTLLAEDGVAHTIVVFGGSRSPRPRVATAKP